MKKTPLSYKTICRERMIKTGQDKKREDCQSPSMDGSCTSPEAKQLNENQGSMSDLHNDIKEASTKHVQDPALAAI